MQVATFFGRIALQGRFGPVVAVQKHDEYLTTLGFGSEAEGCRVDRISSPHEKSGKLIERRIKIKCVGFIAPNYQLGETPAAVEKNLRAGAANGFLLAYDTPYQAYGTVMTGRQLITKLTALKTPGFTCLVATPGANAKTAFGVV